MAYVAWPSGNLSINNGPGCCPLGTRLTRLALRLATRIGSSGGRIAMVAAIPIISISKDVPEAPPNDPVVPCPIVGHRSVVPDPGFGRRCRVDRYDLSVAGRLRDHTRGIWPFTSSGVCLALSSQIFAVLDRSCSSSCSFFLFMVSTNQLPASFRSRKRTIII